MTLSEAKDLRPGDEVYWTDPDDGKCSGYWQIKSVQVRGTIVTIQDLDDSVLDCFAPELELA